MGTVPAEVRIRQEFDEPPSKVIRDLAAMKISKRLAAGAIGIHRETLDRLCERFNVEFVPQREMVSQCKPHGKGWPKGKKRPWAPKPWKRKDAANAVISGKLAKDRSGCKGERVNSPANCRQERHEGGRR